MCKQTKSSQSIFRPCFRRLRKIAALAISPSMTFSDVFCFLSCLISVLIWFFPTPVQCHFPYKHGLVDRSFENNEPFEAFDHSEDPHGVPFKSKRRVELRDVWKKLGLEASEEDDDTHMAVLKIYTAIRRKDAFLMIASEKKPKYTAKQIRMSEEKKLLQIPYFTTKEVLDAFDQFKELEGS